MYLFLKKAAVRTHSAPTGPNTNLILLCSFYGGDFVGGVADAGPHLLPNARALTYALDFDRHANWMDSLNNVSKLLHASLHSQYLSSSLLMSSPRFPHSPPLFFLPSCLLLLFCILTHIYVTTPNFQLQTFKSQHDRSTNSQRWKTFGQCITTFSRRARSQMRQISTCL